MENLEEKYEQLKKMFQAEVEKNAELDTQLEEYKHKLVAKYQIDQELFCLDIKKHEIFPLKVNEVIINKFGVAYREYVSETEFKQYPEILCFANKIDANEYLNKK